MLKIAIDYLSLIQPYLFMIPVYLIWFIIFILAIVKFRSNTGVAVMTLIAIIIFAVSTVISIAWSLISPSLYSSYDWSSSVKIISIVITVLRALLQTIGWGLIAGAIFSGRNKA